MSGLHERLAQLTQRLQQIALANSDFSGSRQVVVLRPSAAISRSGSLFNSRSLLVRCPARVLQCIGAAAGGTNLACVCRKIRQDLLGVTDKLWRHLNLHEMSTQECQARIGPTGHLRIHMYAQHKNMQSLTRLVLDASVLVQLEHLDVYISPDYRQLAQMIGRHAISAFKYPHFALIVPGGAHDAPTVVAAAPFLSRLSIDLGSSRWNPNYDTRDNPRWSACHKKNVSEQMSWSIPLALFAAGSALRTLLIRGIGFPSASLVDCTFLNLNSFTYQGPETIYSSQIDSVLRLAVGLRALSIHCHEFIDNSPVRTFKDINLAANISNVVVGQSYVNKSAGEAGIVWYFWNRGVRDLAVSLRLPSLISDQWNAGFPPYILHIACSDGGVSLHCVEARVDGKMRPVVHEPATIRRIRFMTDGLRNSSNTFLHSLRSIDQNRLTSLSLHEYTFTDLFYGIPDPVVLQSLPNQPGLPPFWTPQLAAMVQNAGLNLAAFGLAPFQLLPSPPAQSFKFPNLLQLTVWIATCSEYRDSLRAFMGMPGSHQTFTGMFSLWRPLSATGDVHVPLSQRCVPPELPRLRTFELSATAMMSERLRDEWCHDLEQIIMTRRGPRFSESEEDRNRLRARWCSCRNGTCVTVCDVQDFLLRHGYATQSLNVRLSGMTLVDVDLHHAVLALQSHVNSVEIREQPTPCEVCQTSDFELLDATATFQQLDGRL